jgi:hypothetical protein
LNGAIPYAQFSRYRSHTPPLLPQGVYLGFYRWANARPPQDLTLRFRSLQASLDPLHDHAAFKLCEHAQYLKGQLPCGGGCVDTLFVEVEVGVLAVEFVEESQEVLQAAGAQNPERTTSLQSQ